MSGVKVIEGRSSIYHWRTGEPTTPKDAELFTGQSVQGPTASARKQRHSSLSKLTTMRIFEACTEQEHECFEDGWTRALCILALWALCLAVEDFAPHPTNSRRFDFTSLPAPLPSKNIVVTLDLLLPPHLPWITVIHRCDSCYNIHLNSILPTSQSVTHHTSTLQLLPITNLPPLPARSTRNGPTRILSTPRAPHLQSRRLPIPITTQRREWSIQLHSEQHPDQHARRQRQSRRDVPVRRVRVAGEVV